MIELDIKILGSVNFQAKFQWDIMHINGFYSKYPVNVLLYFCFMFFSKFLDVYFIVCSE